MTRPVHPDRIKIRSASTTAQQGVAFLVKSVYLMTFSLLVFAGAAAFGQAEDDKVIKVDTDLAVFEVTVTDKNGKPRTRNDIVEKARIDLRKQVVPLRDWIEQQKARLTEEIRVGERVRRQPHPEPGLVDALGVVDLVPEQRQHDHRLAVMERLGDGVVAAVGDHQRRPLQQGDLRQAGPQEQRPRH